MKSPVLMKKFNMPRGGEGFSCKSFVMRELNAKDELEASIWADKTRSEAADGPLAMIGSEHRESVRLSLVYVDGNRVNHNGVPFTAMNDWSMKTMRLLMQAFNDLNGVDKKEVADFSKGAEVFVLPSQEETKKTA